MARKRVHGAAFRTEEIGIQIRGAAVRFPLFERGEVVLGRPGADEGGASTAGSTRLEDWNMGPRKRKLNGRGYVGGL